MKLDIDMCSCPLATDCDACKRDIEARLTDKQQYELKHHCIIHGQVRCPYVVPS